MIELYPGDIAAYADNNRKRRKKVTRTIAQVQYRKVVFKILSHEVGKGYKRLLKKLKIQNQHGEEESQF